MGTVEEANIYLENGFFISLTGYLCKVGRCFNWISTHIHALFVPCLVYIGQIRKFSTETSRVEWNSTWSTHCRERCALHVSQYACIEALAGNQVRPHRALVDVFTSVSFLLFSLDWALAEHRRCVRNWHDWISCCCSFFFHLIVQHHRYCTFQRNEPCCLPALVELIASFMQKKPEDLALATSFNALKLFGMSHWGHESNETQHTNLLTIFFKSQLLHLFNRATHTERKNVATNLTLIQTNHETYFMISFRCRKKNNWTTNNFYMSNFSRLERCAARVYEVESSIRRTRDIKKRAEN